MNKKNNQRFRETEINMESAMLKLMKTYDFEKITVKKICEKAQVNRSTFYAHFIDIYDMLDKMENELRAELLQSYQTEKEKQIFSEKSFLHFLEHIKKHKYFYKINLQTRKSFPLKQGYEELWKIVKTRCESVGITDDEEITYYLISFQAGFTMVLKHWVDTDCAVENRKIAAIIKNCIPGIWLSNKY